MAPVYSTGIKSPSFLCPLKMTGSPSETVQPSIDLAQPVTEPSQPTWVSAQPSKATSQSTWESAEPSIAPTQPTIEPTQTHESLQSLPQNLHIHLRVCGLYSLPESPHCPEYTLQSHVKISRAQQRSCIAHLRVHTTHHRTCKAPQ